MSDTRFRPLSLSALPEALAAIVRSLNGQRNAVILLGVNETEDEGRGLALRRYRSALEGFGGTLTAVADNDAAMQRHTHATDADQHILIVIDDELILIDERRQLDDQLAAALEIVGITTARRWLDEVGVSALRVEVSGSYENGADSLGISLIRVDDRFVVAKSGPVGVIAPEFEYIARVNGELERNNVAPLFPRQLGFVDTGEIGVNLMEAVSPLTLDLELFADSGKTVPRAEWRDVLTPSLQCIDELYRTSVRGSGSSMAEYAYFGRFENVAKDARFLDAFRTFFGPTRPETLLRKSILTPNGELTGGLYDQLEWLVAAQDELLPGYSCLIHGDLHLKNMLTRTDGTPVFVDPRTVWDGIRTSDEGFGDPAYDFATLLHSITPMSAILRRIDDTTTSAPRIPLSVDSEPLDATAVFPWGRSDIIEAIEDDFVRRLVAIAPHDASSLYARSRLYVGAANALFGWLKYERALKTQDAWLSTYVHSMNYLDRAREAFLSVERPDALLHNNGG